jgi:hypothetical protein
MEKLTFEAQGTLPSILGFSTPTWLSPIPMATTMLVT